MTDHIRPIHSKSIRITDQLNRFFAIELFDKKVNKQADISLWSREDYLSWVYLQPINKVYFQKHNQWLAKNKTRDK